MVETSVMVIFGIGEGPDTGITITDAAFSADGTIATGTIPSTLASGTYFITVHRESAILNPPLFNALQFTVTA